MNPTMLHAPANQAPRAGLAMASRVVVRGPLPVFAGGIRAQ